MTIRALATAALATAALAPAASAATSPMTIVYDKLDAVQQLVSPGGGAKGLSPARGAWRQDPGTGGMLDPAQDAEHGAPSRIAKVSGRELKDMSTDAIVALLRREIRLGNAGASSHLVAIDEIGRPFGDDPPDKRRLRRGMRLPAINPESPGSHLSAALQQLNIPSPWGGTWASRVHVYIAPAVTTAIATGRGANRNLGRDGKPHFPTWRAVMPGLSLAGGLHLEMYSAPGGSIVPFSAGMWRAAPAAFLRLFNSYGGNSANVHFVFTGGAGPADAPVGCGDAQACEWGLAESTDAGRSILANGPDLYKIGTDAPSWLREFNARFD
ncbi:MAG: hypothetical protein U0Y82_10095 [Thermoleophilia bacterium]